MKILGLWSGHDCSFCILQDGRPVIHAELERYIREKEPKGDSLQFALRTCGELTDYSFLADEFVSCYPKRLIDEKDQKYLGIKFYGHHMSHAANAFYSSNFNEAAIITIDGGGIEDNGGTETATTIWEGKGTKITPKRIFPGRQVNIGGLWTRVTRYIFQLQNGWPRGHQAGSIMAMAAFGDSNKYFLDFSTMLGPDLLAASMKPAGQPVGAFTGNDPIHPYLDRYLEIAQESESQRFNLAAGLQKATEDQIKEIVRLSLWMNPGTKNVCISGGVALNSVAIGKIRSWFPEIENVFVPPVPYDGGLCIGAAQYHYHHRLGHPRILWEDNFTPYLGEIHHCDYNDISQISHNAAAKQNKQIAVRADVTDDEVLNKISQGEIVSIFNGPSESGRRALGNRSILADPRNHKMKQIINEKVKHRQWYRPFAPSILRESVKDWFIQDVSSPYMTHVIPFKNDVIKKVPAVVHFNGSARLQTVTEKDNCWYYNFLKKWEKLSGVPILLNTSFNDREPICETPTHAINCFLNTDIDHLYFPELGILVSKL